MVSRANMLDFVCLTTLVLGVNSIGLTFFRFRSCIAGLTFLYRIGLDRYTRCQKV